MNAIELFLKDGRPTGVFYCEKCRIVQRQQDIAERCCQNYKCEDCGKDTGGRTWLVCDTCRCIRDAKREREKFDAAKKVNAEDYEGWVYCPGFGRDGFCEIADLLDEIGDMREDGESDKQFPEYAWSCDPSHFALIGIDDIKNHILDSGDCYEDFDADDLNGLDDLSVALNKFNEANAGVVSYSPNYKKAVLLQPVAKASSD